MVKIPADPQNLSRDHIPNVSNRWAETDGSYVNARGALCVCVCGGACSDVVSIASVVRHAGATICPLIYMVFCSHVFLLCKPEAGQGCRAAAGQVLLGSIITCG